MATTTDFEIWLSGLDTEDHHDIYNVYKAVEEVSEKGSFKCTDKETSGDRMYFLVCNYFDDTLLIANEKSRRAFLDLVKHKYIGDEIEIDEWYEFQDRLEKND